MFDIGLIQAIQKLSSPVLDWFFRLFTQLGSHYAYMLVLPFVYWVVDRRVGRRLTGIFLASMWLNGLIKEYWMLPRPSPDLVRVLSDEGGPGFPSGHVQGTVTVWGYLALAFARRWLTWLAAALIVLMCISRLYLGLHFPADVLGGLVLGLVLVLFYHWLTLRPRRREMAIGWRIFWAVFVPVLLYPLYQSSAAEQIIGFFIGFFTADLFAWRVAPFEPRVSPGKQVAKVLIGYAGLAVLVAVHMLFVPVGWPGVFGFSLIALWVTMGAPALFRALGLAGEAGTPPGPRPSDKAVRRYAVAAAIVAAFVVGSTVYVGTAVPAVAPMDALRQDRPLIIAHAGAKGLAPENTMVAFQTAVQAGVDVLEMDVHLTADGHVVVLHDATVNRTTNGTGAVAAMTLGEIQALDAGYRFTPDGGASYPWRGRGVVIPTLDEVLSSFEDIPFIIELKTESEELAQKVLDVVEATGTADRVILVSFHDRPLQYVRRVAPHIPTNLSRSEVTRYYILQRLGVGAFVRPPGEFLHVPEFQGPIRVVHSGLMRLARKQGVEVHVWTVNDEEAMTRLLDLGARGIMTDYPERMHQVLGRLGRRGAGDALY